MFRAAFGQGFRVPSLAERFTDNQDFFPIIRNLKLRPEESTSYEIGVRGGLPLAGQGTAQVDVAVFWNEFENLIEPKLIPEQSAFQFVNLTEARIRGLEAAVDASIQEDRLMLRMAYTFLDTRDFTTDTALAFRPKHLVKAGFDVQVLGPIEAGLDFRYASKPDVLDSDFARFVPDADVLIETRVFDLRLGARWQHARIAALVRNAFEYYYLERPALLAPGREMLLQFQVDF
jgi:outer membrane cobalamin receptor